MSRILVDAYKVKNLNSGLGQFSSQFVNNLIKYGSLEQDISFLLPASKTNLFGSKLSIVKANLLNRHFRSLSNYDIWHSLHQFPAHLPNSKTKQILTVHDLNFLIEKEGKKRTRYLNLLQKRFDNAHVITAISEFTKNEIQKNLNLKGKQVQVIYNGVEIQNELPKKVPSTIVEGDFLFSIGIFNKKKNFHSLIEMMKHMKDCKLILAGNHATDYGKQIIHLIQQDSLQEKVILSGTITESEKNWYYKNCKALVFPSLAEGFGIPPIEAMMHGKPVFLSKYTSLPEIGGDTAFYFDTFDPDYMASKIESCLNEVQNNPNFALQSIEYASRFSWETCIRKYVEIYKELMSS